MEAKDIVLSNEQIEEARKNERERVIKTLASFIRVTDYNWLAMGNQQIRTIFRRALKGEE